MRWRHAVLAMGLVAACLARADDRRVEVHEVMREALLRHATMPSAPPRLPDHETVLPGSFKRPEQPAPPQRGSPPHDSGKPGTPNTRDEGRGELATHGAHDAHAVHGGRESVAAHGADDGHAMRDQMRADMAREAESRVSIHGRRDANAMRGEADHRSSMGLGMGATPGMTGHQDDAVGSHECQDGAEVWRTTHPDGETMSGDWMSGGGHTESGGVGGMVGGGTDSTVDHTSLTSGSSARLGSRR